jgi:uncharacterized protein (UPF0548 family)
MFFRRPSASVVAEFLKQQVSAPFSYEPVGGTRGEKPAGFAFDHNRVQLGQGERDFAVACDALRAWRMFPAPWTSITPAFAPIKSGTILAMEANALGFWWLNACRIVYVIEEAAPVRRFGFAYGTLPAHVEMGEERFCIEQDSEGAVWYDLSAFSRPHFWPVKRAKPLARALQRRFAAGSKSAMVAAVRTARAVH